MAKAKKKARKNPTLRECVTYLEADAKIVQQLLGKHAEDIERHGKQVQNLITDVARLEAGAAPRGTLAERFRNGETVPLNLTEKVTVVVPRDQFKAAVSSARRAGCTIGQMLRWFSEDSGI